ncbi:DUF2249 domain-containing protein [Halomicroarcula sp. GCM10025709]|uniref:DUF2249 domain-containing protein n=1 Tax=Haloarcula TaxID=2237 RepID=UPI0036066480
MFGETDGGGGDLPSSMDPVALLAETDAPTDAPTERLDVRDLGPPEPLRQTLETLADLDDAVLVQENDRAPQHLYPKLDDRGYDYETIETDDATVTIIWTP